MKKGICKLCGFERPLSVSHFIPKFIGKWAKRTSITGFLREHNTIVKRAQDLAKLPWLCQTCENLISDWEAKFADTVFYPFADKNESVASYGKWMSLFCASLSWRTLSYIRHINTNDNKPKEYIEALEAAKAHWAGYMLGREKNLEEYEQHLFPLERIASTSQKGLPPNINRYFLRTIGMDIIGNSQSIFVYTKLPMFIILGFVKVKNPGKMRSSRIALNSGRISPQEYWWPAGFKDYIVEKAISVSEAHDRIPKHHKAKFDEYIRKNPEKAAKSKQVEAFMFDYSQFGEDVFRSK